MPVGEPFVRFIKVEYQEGQGFTAFNRAVDDATQSMAAKFRAASDTASKTLDAALAKPRNASGAFDLDAGAARAAAEAAQLRAAAARQVAAANATMNRSEAETSVSARASISAHDALAKKLEQEAVEALQLARATEQLQTELNRIPATTTSVVRSMDASTRANIAGRDGTRAHKAGMIQLGQQFQDVAIQAQMGTSAFTIFAQQGSQVGFAMAGMRGKLGQVGTFLAGPWGAAITLGAVALGALYKSMNLVGDEAKNAKDKAIDFSGGLDVARLSANDAREAMRQLADETRGLIKVQGDYLDQQFAIAQAGVTTGESRIAALDAEISRLKRDSGATLLNTVLNPGQNAANLSRLGAAQSERAALRDSVGSSRAALTNAEIARTQRTVNESLDQGAHLQGEYNREVAKLLQLRKEHDRSGGGAGGVPLIGAPPSIDQSEYDRRYTALTRKYDADRKAFEASKRKPSTKETPITSAEVARILREEFPGIAISSQARSPNSRLGRANPGSYHNIGQAIDFARTPGLSIDRVRERLTARGVDLKEAKDEYANPSKHATGPHYHVAFGKNRLNQEEGVDRILKDQEDARKEADNLAKEMELLVQQGSNSIGSINKQFQPTPTLISKSRDAVSDLIAEIAQLGPALERNTPGADAAVQAAQQAMIAARNAVPKAITDQMAADRTGYELQLLRLGGLNEEAELRERFAEAESRYGFDRDLDAQRETLAVQERILSATEAGSDAQSDATAAVAGTRAEIERVTEWREREMERIRQAVGGQKELNRLAAISNEMIQRRGQVIGTLRVELEALFAGEGDGKFFANMTRSFNRFRGEVLTEQIFGPALRELEAWNQRNTPLGRATERLVNTVDQSRSSLGEFGDAVRSATSALTRPTAANDNLGAGGVVGAAGFSGSGATAAAALRIAGINGPLNGGLSPDAQSPGIVITGQRQGRPVGEIEGMARATSQAIVDPMLAELNRLFGTDFFTRMGGVFRGGMEGFLRAGPIGGILGAAKGIPGLEKSNEKLFKVLDGALGGAQSGYQTALIGRSLGIKTSATGGALGGAIGSAIPIPGGELIGSIAGSLIGGLFKKAKFGGATIGGTGSNLSVTGTVGNSGAAKRGGTEAADSVIGNLNRIADQLNATVDASRGFVTVGTYKDKVRVNTEGTTLGGSKSPVAGLKDFGDDAEAALRFAVLDLVRDGVLVGLRKGTQQLLQNAKDLEAGLADALSFESVFTRLKAHKDPLGAAMDVLDREFTRLNDIFGKAGATTAEYADLEELYGIERAKVIKEEGERITSALKGLLTDLTINNDARSLRNRLADAQGVYNPLATRVAAGDSAAYDEFATAARAMLDLQRQINGSSSAYFDSLDQVTTLTRTRINAETNIVALTQNRDTPFTSTGAARDTTVSAIESQTDRLEAALAGLGDRLVANGNFASSGGGGGGGTNERNFVPSAFNAF